MFCNKGEKDKLRFQSISNSSQYSEHWSLHNQGQNMDLAQLPSCRYANNVSYEPSVMSSELMSFGSNSQSLVVHKHDPVTLNPDPLSSPRRDNNALFSSNFVSVSGDPQNCSTWKSIGSQQMNQICSDWNSNVASYSSGSLDLMSNVVPVYSEINGQYRQKHLDDLQYGNSSVYPNSIQENIGSGRGLWPDSNLLCVNNSNISNNRALSLSLSSVSPPKTNNVSEDLNCSSVDVLPMRSDHSCSSSKQWTHRNLVPFGPFTGYATILKSSRFLKPAQQLLGELCNFCGHRNQTISELTREVLDEVCLSGDGVINAVTWPGESMIGDSSGLSSAFCGSNERSRGSSGVSCLNGSVPRSEYQQIRVKLLYMQDEVCKRYRQYHQQMQMVVSSFESVAGLSSSTPYIVLALKTISKNFYSLNRAISDQIRNITNILGEEELISQTGHSKGDRVNNALEKRKDITFLDPQPHVWRPQRGLPERAVAVLRAWLFDHFLHPYPTDADKHLLATQTGLTRNQVSNWFINARVRVWKPMVEEIHSLETKAMAEKASNVSKSQVVTTAIENPTQPNLSFAVPDEIRYSNWNIERPQPPTTNWSGAQEKQSRINFHIPTNIDGQLMGFVPYQRNNLEIGGLNNLGSVSLTLGLRQSAEGLQQQQHEPPQLRQQLGGQMIHNYFG